jgi:hypothetical protein
MEWVVILLGTVLVLWVSLSVALLVLGLQALLEMEKEED